ncbi:MAG: helix-turn-helix transcriptional regulator [Pseudomonadales bacterium]|nr:helix-turn-helix transcriptional regulator [Pseudomonadales bacterium]
MNCTQLLNKTEDYLERHLHSKLSLDDLANHLHISKYHFHRQFSRCSAETWYQFVSRVKLERAAMQILVSEQSFTDIAHSYGFSDSSAFSRAFRRHYGMSPRQFRKARIDKFSS